MKIEPSILNADLKNINKEIRNVKNHVERIHIDVMDGKFVKEKTPFTPKFVKSIKTSLVKDVHLMTKNPQRQFVYYKQAGAKIINFHIEVGDTDHLINLARKYKLKVGLVVNPDTKVERVYNFLDKIDEVLLMSVHPGKGGQKFIDVSDKINKLRRKGVIIKVDGGVNDKTIKWINEADYAIVGSFIFKNDDHKKALQKLK